MAAIVVALSRIIIDLLIFTLIHAHYRQQTSRDRFVVRHVMSAGRRLIYNPIIAQLAQLTAGSGR